MGSFWFWFWCAVAALNGWYASDEWGVSWGWVVIHVASGILSMVWANQAWAKWEKRRSDG